MKLKGWTTIVTGAGNGIGRACAQEFAKEGASVVVVDINRNGAEETVRLIKDAGGIALVSETDVADPVSVEQMVKKTIASFSQIHVLLNNAAVQINKNIEDTTFEEWNRQMTVNLGGTFLCSKYCLPHLKKTRGNIVNMASVNGFFVEPIVAGYCATK